MSNFKAPISSSRNTTQWVEGLRGLAALFVMTSHLSLGYADFLESPRQKLQGPSWYNAPFIRVFAEGSPWVSVFLVLTGFVNALKPIKQARAGNADIALAGLASSCFRRTSRLVLPCTIATLICWVLAEAGAFRIGSMVESQWMATTSARPSLTIFAAMCTPFRAILDTWTWYTNELERNQWAMLYFMKGAFTVYLALLALVRTKTKYRMWITIGLVAYGWRSLDHMIFMPMFTGVFLAELSMTSLVTNFSGSRSSLKHLLSYTLVCLGWYLISFPKLHPERMPWSSDLLEAGMKLFPYSCDIHGYFGHIGVTLIITGIVLSSTLQKLFCTWPLQWIGARSFPIYLIHGPVIRSFLNWILFAGAKPELRNIHNGDGELIGTFPMLAIPAKWKFAYALPIFLIVVLVLSDQWNRHIEPRCATATNWLEERICGSSSNGRNVMGKGETGESCLDDEMIGNSLSRATTPINELNSLLPR